MWICNVVTTSHVTVSLSKYMCMGSWSHVGVVVLACVSESCSPVEDVAQPFFPSIQGSWRGRRVTGNYVERFQRQSSCGSTYCWFVDQGWMALRMFGFKSRKLATDPKSYRPASPIPTPTYTSSILMSSRWRYHMFNLAFDKGRKNAPSILN